MSKLELAERMLNNSRGKDLRIHVSDFNISKDQKGVELTEKGVSICNGDCLIP